jgi:UDP-2,3-diacylglucosamine hydrolase
VKAYFLSDLHLKSVNERSGRILLRFLTSLVEEKDKKDFHLFLLGDIFDLWISGHKVFVDKFEALIEPIRTLIEQGANVYFFEGNHDMHIRPFWEDQLGAKVYTSAEYFKLGPWTVRCEHGDEINQDDKAYLALRTVLRHPLVEQVGHKVPGEVWDKVGNFFSKTSRKFSSAYREDKEMQLVKLIRHHAELAYLQKPFDIIFSGHMHVRDDHTVKIKDKEIRSINLGSWFEDPKVLKLSENGVEWISP